MKKLLAFILSVFMVTSAFVGTINAATIINDDTFSLGDVNNDAKVNAADSLIIKQCISGVQTVNKIIKYSADIDADDKITTRDVFYLKSIFVGQYSISDFESSKQIYSLSIAGNSISEYQIFVPSNATSNDNVYFAADQLRKYINISTGINLKIVKGNAYGKAIVFNAVDFHSPLGQELGIESYKYDVTNGTLNIYGTYRGNMYAAYEIIENYLGFRFFDDYEIFLYKSRVVNIPEGTNRIYKPEVAIRNVRSNFSNNEEHALPLHINSTDHGHSFDKKYGLRHGSQFINAHSYGYYWRMATGEMPPESFGTLSERYQEKYNSGEQKNEYLWLPCFTSIDEFDLLYEGMLETIDMITRGWGIYYFTKEYLDLGILSMSFSSCDNTHVCTCRYCSAVSNGTRFRVRSTTEVENLQSILKYISFDIVQEGSTKYASFHKEGFSGLMMNHASLAADKIQELYPGLRVHSILYYHEIPETIQPSKWLNVWYCGTGCNNHWLGSHGCETAKHGQLTYPNSSVYQSNIIDEPALIAWGEICENAGAELWFWYYPVTYHYYLSGCPNILNIYYDYKYLYDYCGVDNFFYEGGGETYNFEKLKGYLAARMAWEPFMSFDDYLGHMKEFLYMEYGDGYEYIFDFIMMEEEAGDACDHCFINNFDRLGDMYSYEYIEANYEVMRDKLVQALSLADTDKYIKRISTLLECFDFLGLSAVYKSWYKEGTAETKALYSERYLTMLQYFNDNNMRIFSDSNTYKLPSKADFTVDPMTQFYEDGSRRPDGAWGN